MSERGLTAFLERSFSRLTVSLISGAFSRLKGMSRLPQLLGLLAPSPFLSPLQTLCYATLRSDYPSTSTFNLYILVQKFNPIGHFFGMTRCFWCIFWCRIAISASITTYKDDSENFTDP